MSASNLFGEPAEPRLGKRQKQVLAWLSEYPGGLTADQVGGCLHSMRGKHALNQTCKYCEQEGRAVLRSLQRRKLATRRKSGVWTVPGKRAGTGGASLRRKGGVWEPRGTRVASTPDMGEIPFL